MKKMKTAARVIIGISVPAALFLSVFLFLKFKSPACLFHSVTGLYCPGCGAGRALDALFHLKIGDALQSNLLFTLSLPLGAAFLVKWYVSVVSGREVMKFLQITGTGAIIYAVITGVFFVARNVPAAPFKYLSPDVFL